MNMFGKKNNYINLTEKEKKQLMKNMTGKQKKEFEKRCRQASSDRETDMLMMMEVFMDDDF